MTTKEFAFKNIIHHVRINTRYSGSIIDNKVFFALNEDFLRNMMLLKIKAVLPSGWSVKDDSWTSASGETFKGVSVESNQF